MKIIQTEHSLERYSKEYWDFCARNLSLTDIKILEYIYSKGCLAFLELLPAMAQHPVGLKRFAVRKRINRLKELGLIDVINSGILILNTIPRIEADVKRFILLWKAKFV